MRVCAASSDAPAQGDARRAPLHAQALRRRESAAAIQARRYAPEKKQSCEVRAYGNAAVAAAAATEATCALDIVVTRRCRAHLCVPRGNPEARGGLCQCHRGKPGWGSWGSPGPSFTQSTPLTSPTCINQDSGTVCNWNVPNYTHVRTTGFDVICEPFDHPFFHHPGLRKPCGAGCVSVFRKMNFHSRGEREAVGAVVGVRPSARNHQGL